MMVFSRAVVFFYVMVCAAIVTAGDFPRQMSYQAVLTDDMGDPLTQNGLSVRYFLYADSTGGSFLWAEVTSIDIVDGQLNHYLGSSCPACGIPDSVFFNQDTLWMEVMVDGESIEPRTKLAAYPYAYRVASIDKTTGGTVTGDISLQSTAGGNAFEVLNSGLGRAGYFQIGNVANTESALITTTNGTGPAFTAFNDGGGPAGIFRGGNVEVQDNVFNTKLTLNPVGPPDGGGYLSVHDAAGAERIKLVGDLLGAGYLTVSNDAGTPAIDVDGSSQHVGVYDKGTAGSVHLNTGALFGGSLTAHGPNGFQTAELKASESGSDGGFLSLGQSGERDGLRFDGEEEAGGGGVAWFYNSNNAVTMWLEADQSDLPGIYMRNQYGNTQIVSLQVASSSGGGMLSMYNDIGNHTVLVDADDNNAAKIILRNASGESAIKLETSDAGGDGRVTTEVLEITGGSDLSEQFNIRKTVDGIAPLPGMVVSIDSEQIGQLKVSRRAYDPAVAGIISGANGIKPGMMMGQSGTITDGDYAVALTGRVYCLVDASFGAVQPGDMLTTSSTVGHAMLASDLRRAPGTIIGKAMSSLESGQGYVLVLVTLQ
ncbi:MAG: hypothetical protein OEV49_14975 [candidate division Zixibacteria bacterium]|nr:hypothetical protein [candidate division Zixibacteria bacterium]MDH3936486.1 hypothetical protein [candidate division Zixibacteria bacterium]MDH4034365.1 hypothetical protein [candidate division Zixibacteria bacterium]